jgi:hypothetical protein
MRHICLIRAPSLLHVALRVGRERTSHCDSEYAATCARDAKARAGVEASGGTAEVHVQGYLGERPRGFPREYLDQLGTDPPSASIRDNCERHFRDRLSSVILDQDWLVETPPRSTDPSTFPFHGNDCAVVRTRQHREHVGIVCRWQRTVLDRAGKARHLHNELIVGRVSTSYSHGWSHVG